MKDPHPKVEADEPPPFLGTWPRVYLAVILYLFVVILIFYLVGRAFTPVVA